eukprot:1158605-Pelagomonas_calceolata.AAC.11
MHSITGSGATLLHAGARLPCSADSLGRPQCTQEKTSVRKDGTSVCARGKVRAGTLSSCAACTYQRMLAALINVGIVIQFRRCILLFQASFMQGSSIERSAWCTSVTECVLTHTQSTHIPAAEQHAVPRMLLLCMEGVRESEGCKLRLADGLLSDGPACMKPLLWGPCGSLRASLVAALRKSICIKNSRKSCQMKISSCMVIRWPPCTGLSASEAA